jgi:hypothetical protein
VSVVHVVLFQPRSDLTDTQRNDIRESLTAAAKEIPGIVSFRVGRRLKHGLPGYEQFMATDYQIALWIEFNDVAGLQDYLRHPAHHALGHHFVASGQAALAYDYDVVDVSAADSLLR